MQSAMEFDKARELATDPDTSDMTLMLLAFYEHPHICKEIAKRKKRPSDAVLVTLIKVDLGVDTIIAKRPGKLSDVVLCAIAEYGTVEACRIIAKRKDVTDVGLASLLIHGKTSSGVGVGVGLRNIISKRKGLSAEVLRLYRGQSHLGEI